MLVKESVISTPLKGSFWTKGSRSIQNLMTLNNMIKQLFINGEQGFTQTLDDYSILYQDAAGTTTVTGVGQTLGLVLDKSRLDGRGIINRALWSSDITNTVWSALSASKLGANSFQFTATGTNSVVQQTCNFGVTSNKTITVSCRIWVSSGTNTIKLKNTQATVIDKFSSDITVTTIPTRVSFTVNNSAGGNGNQLVGVTATASTLLNQPIFMDSFQVEEGSASVYQANTATVGGTGNHAVQSTSSYRPLLQNTPRRVQYDGIDDKLTTTLSSQLTGCTVIRAIPNVGCQILTDQTIPTTYSDSTSHCGLIVINRALTTHETVTLTKIFNKLAGV